MSQTRSSYEPTRLTAGQAATTAPTGPWDQPCAMFAVRVAAIPSASSQRAREGGYRHPAPRCVQDHHRAGVDQAVDCGRLEPGGDPGLAVGEDGRVGVPVGDVCRDARHGEHGRRGGQADGAIDAARQGCGRVIADRSATIGAEPAADYFGRLCPLGSSAYRTHIGPGETGVGHGLLLHGRLGGIWEAASGANRREPGPTELKQSLRSGLSPKRLARAPIGTPW